MPIYTFRFHFFALCIGFHVGASSFFHLGHGQFLVSIRAASAC